MSFFDDFDELIKSKGVPVDVKANVGLDSSTQTTIITLGLLFVVGWIAVKKIF